MIRDYLEEDLEEIVDIAICFEKESNLFQRTGGVNREIFKNNLRQYYKKGMLKIWVVEERKKITAALGVIIGKDILSGQTGINELFWYSHPEFRGSISNIKLIKKMEKYAISINAKYIMMFHLSHFKEKQLNRFYMKTGYKKCQSQYIKAL